MKYQAEFYAKLYTVDENVQFKPKNPTITKLNNEQGRNKFSSDSERNSALAKIPRKRTPDVDRLPADFYRMFCQAQICIVGLLL